MKKDNFQNANCCAYIDEVFVCCDEVMLHPGDTLHIDALISINSVNDVILSYDKLAKAKRSFIKSIQRSLNGTHK